MDVLQQRLSYPLFGGIEKTTRLRRPCLQHIHERAVNLPAGPRLPLRVSRLETSRIEVSCSQAAASTKSLVVWSGIFGIFARLNWPRNFVGWRSTLNGPPTEVYQAISFSGIGPEERIPVHRPRQGLPAEEWPTERHPLLNDGIRLRLPRTARRSPPWRQHALGRWDSEL